MKKITVLKFMFLGIFLMYSNSFSQNNIPITTPIKWEGMDTLSKFYQFEQFKKMNKIDENKTLVKDTKNSVLDLITDPRVIYSSYFGGNGYDCSYGIAVDSKDNMYLVGYTGSTNLPVTKGCFQDSNKGNHDAFIAKFTPEGQPVWITYYGGSRTDVATGCVIDKEDNIYVVGKTTSSDFPLTSGSYKGGGDAFILKFTSTGERLWAIPYGSADYDYGQGIALMSDGGVVITGYTGGIDLPVTSEALYKERQGYSDLFIARFSKNGELIWGTYYGGYQYEVANCIATDKDDNIAVGGYNLIAENKPNKPIYPTTPDAFQRDTIQYKDAILLVLSKDCKLKYSTLYGGHAERLFMGDGDDMINGVTFDSDGNIYCCGYTSSYDFPTTANAYKPKYDSHDAFIFKFSNTYKRLWATYYGGSVKDGSDDIALSIYCNENNELWITGWTNSYDFPVIGTSLTNVVPPSRIGGNEILLLKMNYLSIPIYSGYFTYGFGYTIYSKKSQFFISGETTSARFPYTQNAFQNRIIPIEKTSYLIKLDLTITDIIESKNENIIVILTNTSKELLEIRASNNSFLINNVKIFDIYGRLINKIDNYINSSDLSININNYTTGIYLIQININNQFYNYKFIKE